jgi:hypothetical protein
MTVLTVRYEARPEHVDDLVAAIEKAFAAVHQAQPQGIRYGLGRLPDGVTFVGVLELADGVDNPLPGIAAARELQQQLAGWVVGEPPVPQPLDVVGDYHLFG